MKKIVSILLVFAMILSISSIAYAMPSALENVEAKAPGDSAGTVVSILGVIQWIGYAFALGMLIYIGIRYVMAAANEKADLKKGSINYVIGAIVIAGAVTICDWIISFGDGLNSETTPKTEQAQENGGGPVKKPVIGGDKLPHPEISLY